jgi:hypothetical protein
MKINRTHFNPLELRLSGTKQYYVIAWIIFDLMPFRHMWMNSCEKQLLGQSHSSDHPAVCRVSKAPTGWISVEHDPNPNPNLDTIRQKWLALRKQMSVWSTAAGDINSPHSSAVQQSICLYHWQWNVTQWYQRYVSTATTVTRTCPTLHYTRNACLV